MSVSMYFTCIARGSCRSHDTAVCTRGHRAVAWSHKAAGSLLPVQGQSPGSQTHTHFIADHLTTNQTTNHKKRGPRQLHE